MRVNCTFFAREMKKWLHRARAEQSSRMRSLLGFLASLPGSGGPFPTGAAMLPMGCFEGWLIEMLCSCRPPVYSIAYTHTTMILSLSLRQSIVADEDDPDMYVRRDLIIKSA